MKRLLPFILPIVIWAQSYPEVIARIDRSYAVQSAEQLEKAALESYRAAKGKHLPSVDAELNAVKLNRTPTVMFASSPMQTGSRDKISGELLLTYPFFSGFAITASVEKAKLHHEKAVLQVADLKRNLYLNATVLYTGAAAFDSVIAAQEEAKTAIEASYKKAQGLYRNGMLAPSALYAIEAKGYEIDAQLTESRNAKQRLLNRLSYLADMPVNEVALPSKTLFAPETGQIEQAALTEREDLLSLAKMVGIARSDSTLARSRWYPNIALVASLKRQGDTFELNGDGYSNADQSYAGAIASWNIFSGMSDWHTLESSKAAEMAAVAAVEDYKRQITVEIHNTQLQIDGTRSQLSSAQMQIKAAEEYANLTRGRFENQLSSADELSRSIADLAGAKSNAAVLESELFNLTISLWLQGGLEVFRKKALSEIPLITQ
jgi:outer membrane protein TolC